MFYTLCIVCNHVIIDIITIFVIVLKTVIPCAWYKGMDKGASYGVDRAKGGNGSQKRI